MPMQEKSNINPEEWRKGRQMQENARKDVENEEGENWAVVVMWSDGDNARNKKKVLKSVRVPI